MMRLKPMAQLNGIQKFQLYCKEQLFVHIDLLKPLLLNLHKKLLVTDISFIAAYCGYTGNICPEGEHVIANNQSHAYHYAREVLRGPFPLGEPAIAKNPYLSLHYAKYVLNGRFPAGEKILVKRIEDAFSYAKWILQDRFELFETTFDFNLSNPHTAYYLKAYLCEVTKSRFYRIEPLMLMIVNQPLNFTHWYLSYFNIELDDLSKDGKFHETVKHS